jgi:hypothetical protein
MANQWSAGATRYFSAPCRASRDVGFCSRQTERRIAPIRSARRLRPVKRGDGTGGVDPPAGASCPPLR